MIHPASSLQRTTPIQGNEKPEVNLKNVLTGLIAIVTGRNRIRRSEKTRLRMFRFLALAERGYLCSFVCFTYRVAPPLLDLVGLTIVFTRSCLKLNLLSGYLIV
ncbi:hypothetical protein AtEden1_Chr00c003g0323991 [Arabidopsis thaliana]